MDSPGFQPILDSAKRAAASGDYASAEALLREAARLQAATLGTRHPDLASTFNNLGVICERTNKLVDAGRFYQQAFIIASASLDAEDPFLITSRTNFSDFCRLHGMVDEPELQTADTAPAVRTLDFELPAAPDTHRPAVAIGAVMAIVMVGAVGIWLMRTPSSSGTAQDTSPSPVQQDVPASPSASVSSSADNPSPLVETNTPAETPPPSTEGVPAKKVAPTPTGEDLRVVEASLCQRLSIAGGRWDCDAAATPEAGDSLYFYTRISTPQRVRIHHRWYRNGRLRQDVNLAVQANPSAGYRTYSRQRVDAGQWRVEVVAADGATLREERIAIR